MDKISKIEYNVIEYREEMFNSVLKFNIKGNNINYIIINTIRRIILTNIPIYSFTNFNFTCNESVFNNNYLKLRFNNLPVVGIPNNIDIYKKETVSEINIDNMNEVPIEDDIDTETNTNINSSSLDNLTMYVDYKSKENTIENVTTNHAKFYYGGKNIDSPYKNPILLVKLQPNQHITFSAITSLGIEKENGIFSAVCVCYYNEINDNEYDFIIESRGQISEFRIIEVAIINILNKIEIIYNLIPNNNNIEGEIVLLNEDNTFGNLITHALQNHKNVKFAGYNIPHLLEERVIIHYELHNKQDIKDILNDCFDYLKKIYNQILDLNNSNISTKKSSNKKKESTKETKKSSKKIKKKD